MRILVTGATGLVGTKVVQSLFELGHDLVLLTRDKDRTNRHFSFPVQAFEWSYQTEKLVPQSVLQGVDGVIHLMGDSVAEGRWTKIKKDTIYRSRVESTRLLRQSFEKSDVKPKFFISASAIGIYGNGGAPVTESSSLGDEGKTFLAGVCRAWENETITQMPNGVRAVALRFGAILSRHGGALSALLPIFQAGLGGPLGSGQGAFNWIHIDDVIRTIVFCIENEKINGSLNCVAPVATTQRDLAINLGLVLKKPAVLSVPEFALQMALGEKFEIILGTPQVIPSVLLQSGFVFKFGRLEDALRDLLESKKIEAVQWISASIEKVFKFFSDEKNLEALTPPWLQFSVIGKSTDELRQGSEINYKLKVHGIPMSWKSRIDRWEQNQVFQDTQVSGPYKKWEHIHSFVSCQGGTLIKDEVVYEIPGGKWLAPLAGCWVDRDVESIFEYRKKKITEIFSQS